MSDKIEASSSSYVDHLRLISERVQQYEQFFKEIIKYNTRAKVSTKSIQKALELIQSLPKRADEAVFTSNITNFPGDVYKLGRIVRQVSIFKTENKVKCLFLGTISRFAFVKHFFNLKDF